MAELTQAPPESSVDHLELDGWMILNGFEWLNNIAKEEKKLQNDALCMSEADVVEFPKDWRIESSDSPMGLRNKLGMAEKSMASQTSVREGIRNGWYEWSVVALFEFVYLETLHPNDVLMIQLWKTRAKCSA